MIFIPFRAAVWVNVLRGMLARLTGAPLESRPIARASFSLLGLSLLLHLQSILTLTPSSISHASTIASIMPKGMHSPLPASLRSLFPFAPNPNHPLADQAANLAVLPP
jgi:hypothetical protein